MQENKIYIKQNYCTWLKGTDESKETKLIFRVLANIKTK